VWKLPHSVTGQHSTPGARRAPELRKQVGGVSEQHRAGIDQNSPIPLSLNGERRKDRSRKTLLHRMLELATAVFRAEVGVLLDYEHTRANTGGGGRPPSD
jgi:hypothetical protein